MELINYREFDIYKEDFKTLLGLFDSTYGDSKNYRKRWEWECLRNPKADSLKIIIAQNESHLVGATSRLPFDLIIDGQTLLSAFSVNSMVHPNFRRMGIMENLYRESFKIFPLLFSKGTMPGMYKLLLKIGYQTLTPNTVLTTVLSPIKWLGWRAGLFRAASELKTHTDVAADSYKPIENFSNEFDEFWNRVHSTYKGIVAKNYEYMNWRYVHIPHRKYVALYRWDREKIVTAIVLGSAGSTGKIVDIVWDQNQKDEPFEAIKFAKRYFNVCGFIKASCWCTHKQLRSALKSQFFVDRGETPNFSYFSNDSSIHIGSDVSDFHFVEGDGDSEYL
jgi:hypothetical protein